MTPAPIDPNLDDSADANRERAREFLRLKLATAAGPRQRLLEHELKRVERESAGGCDNSGWAAAA